jgi:NAD(P)H-dependent flavin oxidoreductase YrpB (nitropropane dioxygenase family)
MFLVSGPDLVVAAASAGVVGAFPTLNARTPEILDSWLEDIAARSAGAPGSPSTPCLSVAAEFDTLRSPGRSAVADSKAAI